MIRKLKSGGYRLYSRKDNPREARLRYTLSAAHANRLRLKRDTRLHDNVR